MGVFFKVTNMKLIEILILIIDQKIKAQLKHKNLIYK